MKVYLFCAASVGDFGGGLYCAMSEHGEALYTHWSSSHNWGMKDLRSGLERDRRTGIELIETAPPQRVLDAAALWDAYKSNA